MCLRTEGNPAKIIIESTPQRKPRTSYEIHTIIIILSIKQSKSLVTNNKAFESTFYRLDGKGELMISVEFLVLQECT